MEKNIKKNVYIWLGLPRWLSGKESACNARDAGDVSSIPGSERSPGEGNPVFLPGESHGQRRLAGYSPWGPKESNTTEQLTLSLFTFR